MNHHRLLPALIPILLALTLGSCQSGFEETTLTDTPAPAPEKVILEGQLIPYSPDDVVGGRRVALCNFESERAAFPFECTVNGIYNISAPDGSFRFEGIPALRYALLIESGSGDFDAALEDWKVGVLRPGEWEWIRDRYLGLEEGETVNLNVPESLTGLADPADYAVKTLMLADSAFYVAHSLGETASGLEPGVLMVDLRTGGESRVEALVFTPRSYDLESLREGIGPLSRAENDRVAIDVSTRWAAFIRGDDSAFRDTDLQIITGLREGRIFPIGNTFLTPVETDGDTLVKRITYTVTDPTSGERVTVGTFNPLTGNVTESVNGFEWNVRDIPGEWIESGPNGEQFYHYGFSYYRRWKRIFPDPLIVEIETFYNLGPGHVAFFLGDYQKARQAIGGDMNLIAWDSSVPEEIATFMPGNVNGAYMTMPDSGTVDVRRERFLEAIINGLVSVDNGSVLSFVNSDQGVYGPYIANPDPVEVTNALLTPYRSGHLYTDMEAAIILAATYEGEGPLRIRITNRLNAGFQVPRGGDKEILIARNEVANVILGYGGTLTGRWPHEMGHIIDFRDPQFRVRRPAAGSACEPLKYLMEFNWWAARYNYDAPDFDWMPISSGLTLARLLTDTYPNSGC